MFEGPLLPVRVILYGAYMNILVHNVCSVSVCVCVCTYILAHVHTCTYIVCVFHIKVHLSVFLSDPLRADLAVFDANIIFKQPVNIPQGCSVH